MENKKRIYCRCSEPGISQNRLFAYLLLLVGCSLGSMQCAAQCSAPTISSLSTYSGNSGSSVTITGTGFDAASANDIVYFGGIKGTVTSASTTSLSVTIPTGGTYAPVSVLNSACNLAGYSQYSFLPTYNNSSYLTNAVNFDTAVTFSLPVAHWAQNVAVGDLDGDGKPEIVVQQTSLTLSIYRNISTAGSLTSSSFASFFNLSGLAVGMNNVVLADMDGDGKLDIVVSYGYPYKVFSVFRNIYSGGTMTGSSFVRTDFGPASTLDVSGIAVADIDGDGKPDVIVTNNGSAKGVYVYRNTSSPGSTSFLSGVGFATGTGFTTLCTADIDGDGKQDIICANASDSICLFRNTATTGTIDSTSLAANVNFPSASSAIARLSAGDLDGDGKPDIIMTSQNMNLFDVYPNTATTGTINSTSIGTIFSVTTLSTPSNLSLGDINGDGKPDLVVAYAAGSDISVFLNASTPGSLTAGSFTTQVDFNSNTSGPIATAVADLDGDNLPDMVSASSINSKFSVFHNDPLHPITGSSTICSGTTTLSETTPNGTWSSSNTAVATVGSTGVVTGVSAGTATISYTGTAGSSYAGNIATVNVTVSSYTTLTVAPISGNTTLSTAITTTLANATSGGVWSSANPAVATVGSTGVVSGLSAGTAVISYTVSTPCNTATATTNVTVKSPTNGLEFDGVNDYVDIDTILTGGHSYTKEAWVYLNSYGPHNIFSSLDYPFWVNGTVLMMSNSYAHSGYAYINDPDSFPLNQWVHVAATYDSATNTARLLKNGVVVASSTSFPTYTSGSLLIGSWLGSYTWDGMMDEVRLWDTALSPATIQAQMNCDVPRQSHLVAYYRFDQGTAGGSNGSVSCAWDYSGDGNSGTFKNFALTGSTSNFVTGAVGSCNTITQTTPGAIAGNTPVCVGSTITLTNPASGGTWSASGSHATVNSTTGVVTGVSAGTATINYTLNCSTTTVTVTVAAYPTVGAIVGNMTLSTSIPTTLASGTSGGIWTSANTAIATIGSASGVVSGVSAGTANMSYTVTSLGCSTTVTATVTVKAAINCLSFDGTDDYVHVPTGLPDTLSDLTYEAWVQPNSFSGFHSILNSDGFSSGAAHFQFSGSTLEFSVSGASPTDQFSTYSFTTGQWYHVAVVYSSSSKFVKFYIGGNLVDSLLYTTAPVIPGGTPYSIGGWYNGGISRSFSGNIDEVRVWNVGRTRSQIHANMNCSVPQNTNLIAYFRFDQGTAGGTNTALTCVYDYSGNNHSGTITNATLTGSTSNYINGGVGSCAVITLPAPGTISGNTPVCVGSSFTLSDATSGGYWSAGAAAVAVGSTTGIVSGVTAGTASVNYTLNCSTASVTVTVNSPVAVSPIAGVTTLSTAITTTLTDTTASGSWVSASPILSVSSSGVVSGTSAGIGIISYVVGTAPACVTMATVNVNVNTPLTGLNFDGVDDHISVPHNTKIPVGNSAVTVECWLRNSSGTNSLVTEWGFDTLCGQVKIQIRGISQIMADFGGGQFFSGPMVSSSDDSDFRGTLWHHVAVTCNGSLAKIYCDGSLLATHTLTAPLNIQYASNLCVGGSIFGHYKGDMDEFRIWKTVRTQAEIWADMRCSIPQDTNLVLYYRFDQGTAGADNSGNTCVYDYSGNNNTGTLTNFALTGTSSNYITGALGDCNPITLPVAGAISGNAPVCAGSSFTLTNATAGGYWSTSDTTVTVDSVTGLVTGVHVGTATVNYSLNCSNASVTVTVNPIPAIAPITGTTTVSITASSTLSDTTAGGVWSSANPAVAVIGTTGSVNGLAAGSAVISYSVGSCAAATTTVNVPANSVPSFTGGSVQSLAVCLGAVARPINSLMQIADGDIGQTETYSIVAGSGPLHGTVTTGGTALSAGAAVSPTGWSYTPTGGYVGSDAFTIQVSDGAGGTATTTINVTVNTAMPAIITMTGGGGYCAGGVGTNVGLAGSAVGIDYQLYLSGAPVGAPVPGIGMALNFGPQTVGGTYTATATNPASGCTATMVGSVTVIVEPLPTVYTLTGGGSYCSGGTGVPVALFSSDIGYHYQLYRGALPLVGTTISGTGASLSFGLQTVAGSYTIVATNNVTGCTNLMSGIDTVTVNALPTPYDITGGGRYCAGDAGVPVGLASSQTGINYRLFRGTTAVGTAVTGTGSALSFGTQTIAGTYTVMATDATTGCSTAMSGSATVTVTASPVAYTVTGGGGYCVGGAGVSIGLSGSQAGISYQLYNGSSTSGSPLSGSGGALSFGLHTAAGTYTVIGTGACSATMTGTATVSVNALPTVYTVTGGGTSCSGTSGIAVGLIGSDLGVSYQLYRGTLAIGSAVAGTGSAISFGPQSTSGTYTVNAINRTTGCSAGMSGSAVVSLGSLPAVVSVTGGGGFCSGGTGVHVGLTGSAAGVSYQLYLGGTPAGTPLSGTGASLDFGPQTTGGIYTATATNSTGCTSTMSGSATITVLAAPTVYSVTGGGGYCSGGTGAHVGLTGSTSGVTYKLYNTGSLAATHTGAGSALDFGLFTASGTYTAIAINGSGCTSTMAGSTTVSVNPNPAVSGTTYTVAPGSTITLSGSITGGTWTSVYTAYATIGSSSGIVTGVAAGATIVSYTLPTGCYGVHNVYVRTSGFRENPYPTPVSKTYEVGVYPNPNRGTFSIKGTIPDTNNEDVTITISDMSGRMVYQKTIVAENGTIEEQVQLTDSYPAGIYLLVINSTAGEKVYRLVVER